MQCTTSCGDIKNISYPFRLKGDPAGCGDSQYELSCSPSNKTILEIHSGKYYVKRISYDDRIITVVDVDLADGSCGLPQKSLSRKKMFEYNEYRYYIWVYRADFVRCSSKISDPTYRRLPCLNIGNQSYVYVIYDDHYYVKAADLLESCSFISMVPIPEIHKASADDNPSYETIQKLLQSGFDLKWSVGCKDCGPYCDWDQDKCILINDVPDVTDADPDAPIHIIIGVVVLVLIAKLILSSIREIQSDSSTELLESESIEECSNADTYDV
ncbi:hypothetical protein Q3G72_018696 [Acer saccharum]|nr:hypothetical protein Q3G72_018696 [Acer saccharum]